MSLLCLGALSRPNARCCFSGAQYSNGAHGSVAEVQGAPLWAMLAAGCSVWFCPPSAASRWRKAPLLCSQCPGADPRVEWLGHAMVCVCVCVCVCSLCVNTRPGLGRQLLGAPAAELFPAESITCVNSTAANREHWLLPGRLIGGRIGDTEGGSSLGLYKGVSCAAGWLVPQLGSRRASPQHPLPPLLPLLFLEGE